MVTRYVKDPPLNALRCYSAKTLLLDSPRSKLFLLTNRKNPSVQIQARASKQEIVEQRQRLLQLHELCAMMVLKSESETVILKPKRYRLAKGKSLGSLHQVLSFAEKILEAYKFLEIREIAVGGFEEQDVVEAAHWTFDLSDILFRPLPKNALKLDLHSIVKLIFRALFGFMPDSSQSLKFNFDCLWSQLEQGWPSKASLMPQFLRSWFLVIKKKQWSDFFKNFLQIQNIPQNSSILLHQVTHNLQKDLLESPKLNQAEVLDKLQPRYLAKAMFAFKLQQGPLQVQVGFGTQMLSGFKLLSCLISEQQTVRSRIIHTTYFNNDKYDLLESSPFQYYDQYLEKNSKDSKADLVMHAYPYALAVWLLGFLEKHPRSQDDTVDIVHKTAKMLFQVSAINHYELKVKAPPLGDIQSIRTFDSVKGQFRQTINFAYKHFLELAYAKYQEAALLNRGNQPMQANGRRIKELGLQCYRTAGLLLQGSLVRRKEGKNVGVRELLTSGRKQIQKMINELLQKYFSKRI